MLMGNKFKTVRNIIKRIFSITKSYDRRYQIIYILGIKLKFKRKTAIITEKDKDEYINFVLNHGSDKSQFVKESNEDFKNTTDIKPVCWYLPQYHDFEENVKWFGKGFSEWSNTSKSVPQFTGHYQPHIPIDVGYYNLNSTLVMKRQIELAKKYGVYGFGFYYYWFSGKKLMEKPIENFLKDKSLDMPFFLFWANEHWTKLWGDGQMNKILFKQELNKDDHTKFMEDILPYMKDSRYIKINNKPVLVIYQLEIYKYERYIEFVDNINKIAKENGFDGIYIISPIRSDMDKKSLNKITDKYKLDGMFEFIPMGFVKTFKYQNKKLMKKNFEGRVFDVEDFIKNKKYFYETDCKKLYKGIFPCWDNSPRKSDNGCYIFQSTPENFKIWLQDLIKWTKQTHKPEEQFIFINAWNEWAEGAHMEPDQRNGYAYLQALKDCL